MRALQTKPKLNRVPARRVTCSQRLPSPSAQVDVSLRPQLERGDWQDEDRRAGLVHNRFAITPDRPLAGKDPLPST